MTTVSGSEFQAIRRRLGLSVVTFGRALGYAGNDNTVSTVVRRYESDGRPIPPAIGRLAVMLDRHGIPAEFLATADPPRR